MKLPTNKNNLVVYIMHTICRSTLVSQFNELLRGALYADRHLNALGLTFTLYWSFKVLYNKNHAHFSVVPHHFMISCLFQMLFHNQSFSHKDTGHCWYLSKTLLDVSQHRHTITNMWKFELIRSSKWRDNNERKNNPVTWRSVLS